MLKDKKKKGREAHYHHKAFFFFFFFPISRCVSFQRKHLDLICRHAGVTRANLLITHLKTDSVLFLKDGSFGSVLHRPSGH